MLKQYTEIDPLESKCAELLKKIESLIAASKKDGETDKRQDKSIKEIQTILRDTQNILRILEASKADKEYVRETAEKILERIYENFYTKDDCNELFFRPKKYVDVLPDEGKENILYLVEYSIEEEVFYKKYVFADGSWIYLGTTDTVANEEFEGLVDRVETLENITSGVSGFVTYDEFVSGLSEVYDTIVSGMTGITDFLIDYVDAEISGITEEISSILERQEEDEKRLSYVEDFLSEVPSSTDFAMLSERLKVAENKIENLIVKGLDETTVTGNITSDKDLLITGPINSNAKITAPTITIKNSTITNNARIALSGNEDIIVKSTDFEGDFPRRQGGNTVVSINTPGDVTLKHLKFNTPATGTAYNAIEIGLQKQPANILIENCEFGNRFENIPIIIYGVQNDAIININNVHFTQVSNCFRFSNCTNATGVTFNITNCTCDQWNIDDDWSGMFLFEDYTSTDLNVVENNLFGDEKVRINVYNFTYKAERIERPEDIASVCGTRDYSSQIFYIWNDKEGFVPYSRERYPEINIF